MSKSDMRDYSEDERRRLAGVAELKRLTREFNKKVKPEKTEAQKELAKLEREFNKKIKPKKTEGQKILEKAEREYKKKVDSFRYET